MRWGRAYFAVQAVGGAVWWIAVFTVPFVRQATLGGLDPLVLAALDLPLFVGASALAACGVQWAAVVATGWTLLVTAGLAAYATVTTLAGWGVLVMAGASAGSLVGLCLMRFGRVPTERITAGPFGFRPADAGRSARVNLGATLAQLLVFWTLFLVAIPLVIAWVEQRWRLGLDLPPPARGSGVVLLVLASALGVWAALSMSTKGHGTPLPSSMPNRLVIAGPYRFVRNPMAVAGIAQGVAVGLLLSSWLVIAYAVIGAVVWNVGIRPLEEADLEARFGDEFRRYRTAVRCWWPRIESIR
jgi:protein-S-isoprenylcysteine O-methyltransferase Ste14